MGRRELLKGSVVHCDSFAKFCLWWFLLPPKFALSHLFLCLFCSSWLIYTNNTFSNILLPCFLIHSSFLYAYIFLYYLYLKKSKPKGQHTQHNRLYFCTFSFVHTKRHANLLLWNSTKLCTGFFFYEAFISFYNFVTTTLYNSNQTLACIFDSIIQTFLLK